MHTSKYEEVKQNFLSALSESIELVIDRELEKFDNGYMLPAEPAVVSFVRGLYYLTLAEFTNPLAHHIAWRALERIRVDDNSTTALSTSSSSPASVSSGMEGRAGSTSSPSLG